MAGSLDALASRVDSKISYLRDALAEYRDLRTAIDEVTEERNRLQQEEERLHSQMLEALEAMKKDALASKNTLTAASAAITESMERICQQDKELEVLKRKLQESEAKNNRAEQQFGSSTPIQPRRVQTRSMDKRKRPAESPLDNEYSSQLDDESVPHLEMENHNVQVRTGSMELSERNVGNELVNEPSIGQTSGISLCNNEELEFVRNELIKGFLVIDAGGRKMGIKEMGVLNEKAFKIACLEKLPPEEVGARCYELYSSWQKQLSDLSWCPFKTVTVDGNSKEIVDVDDDKLQELKSEWGEVAHNAVVKALTEMQEYNRVSDRSITYELWNYKEGRKATTKEGVEYLCSQVKQLSVMKRRKTRR